MGEKGIGGGALAAIAPDTNSLIERTTTSVVTSVTGVGQDLVTTMQEKTIGALADEAVRAARQQLSATEADDGELPEVIPPEEPPAR
jgi:hypothetical protein